VTYLRQNVHAVSLAGNTRVTLENAENLHNFAIAQAVAAREEFALDERRKLLTRKQAVCDTGDRASKQTREAGKAAHRYTDQPRTPNAYRIRHVFAILRTKKKEVFHLLLLCAGDN
jgi:hypothetical protein